MAFCIVYFEVFSSSNLLCTTVYYLVSGELFAVGSFNTLRLCDKTGVKICLYKICVSSGLNYFEVNGIKKKRARASIGKASN